jgi:hypothetical protein
MEDSKREIVVAARDVLALCDDDHDHYLTLTRVDYSYGGKSTMFGGQGEQVVTAEGELDCGTCVEIKPHDSSKMYVFQPHAPGQFHDVDATPQPIERPSRRLRRDELLNVTQASKLGGKFTFTYWGKGNQAPILVRVMYRPPFVRVSAVSYKTLSL